MAQTTLSFDVEQGSELAEGEITGTLTGVTEPVTLVVVHTNAGIQGARFELTSPTSGRLLVTPKSWELLAPGTYRDTIQINACLDTACTRQIPGSPKEVAVTYTVRTAAAPAHLQLSQRGVAFAAVAGRSHLSQDVSVRDSTGAASSWTAVADASWLMVTARGSSDGTLRLQADALAVAALPEGQHLATVTVRSSNAAIAQAQTVRVGLFKRDSAGVASLSQPLLTSGTLFRRLTVAVDSVQPLHYSSLGERIAIDHFYSGERLGTITVPGADLTDLAPSDDGLLLYALDAATRSVVVVDVASRSVSARVTPRDVSLGSDSNGARIAFARVAGQPMLLLNEGTLHSQPFATVSPIIDAVTGQARGRVFGYNGSPYTVWAPTAGPVVYAADTGITGGGLSTTRIELLANSTGKVYGLARQTPAESVSAGLVDFGASLDGMQVVNMYYGSVLPKRAVYSAAGTGSLNWAGVGGEPLPFGVGASSVEFGPDGRWVVISDYRTMRQYDASGALLRTWTDGLPAGWVDPALRTQIKLSSDGLRLLGATTFMDLPN